MRLGFCGVEELPAEPPSSSVLSDPERIDVAASAPRPAGKPCYELTLLVSELSMQKASVVDPVVRALNSSMRSFSSVASAVTHRDA
jgi:hypothetical protein